MGCWWSQRPDHGTASYSESVPQETPSRKRFADGTLRSAADVQEDFYGFSRDEYGRARFRESSDASQVDSLTAVQARIIAEVALPRGGLPGLPAPIADYREESRRVKYIMTSPNMSWVPDISLQKFDVAIMQNGRFGYNDFTLWPQFYFAETRHLCFVRSKPPADILPTHEFRVLWHDLIRADFVYEQSGLLTSIGRITASLHEELMLVRQKLTTRINSTLNDNTLSLTPHEKRILSTCSTGMQLTSVSMNVAPQLYFAILATFTYFQRHALEALACLDMIHIWAKKIHAAPDTIPLDSVDRSVMGTVTWEPTVAVELHAVGVPVWLVRPPQHVPSDITILEVGDPIPLVDTNATTPHQPYTSYHSSSASPAKIRICLSLHLGHIHLGGVGGGPSGVVLPSQGPVTPATSLIQSPGGQIPFNGLVTARTLFPVPKSEQRNVSPVKYEEPACSFTPDVLPNWRTALQTTLRRPTAVYFHDDLPTFRGYSLMDPYVLAKDGVVGDRALIVWLYMRAAWISKVSTEWPRDGRFPSSQDWRNLVIAMSRRLGLLTEIASTDRLAVEAQSLAKFPINFADSLTPTDLYWRGSKVLDATAYNVSPLPVSNAIRREVLYDLFEQNFRLEVFALDKCIVYRRDLPFELAVARDTFVMNMFPNGILVSVGFAFESVGSGSVPLRAVAVNNFRRILMGWGAATVRLHPERFRLDSSSSPQQLDELERLLFSIYCNQFFLYFGRPPTIPHVCPT